MSSVRKTPAFIALLFILISFVTALSGNASSDITLRIGVFQNKPLSYVDDSGAAQGIYPDIIREIAREENWQLTFVDDSWSGNLARLESGDIDLMVSIVYSEARDRIFDFSKEPVVTAWGQVYSTKDSGILSILDLEGKSVAVMEKDINARHFSELCRKFNVNSRLVSLPTYDDVCNAVMNGLADAGVINNVNGEFLKSRFPLYSTPIMFSPVNALFAAPEKKNSEIIKRIDQHLSEWRKDHQSVYYQILAGYFGTPGKERVSYRLVAGILSVAAVLVVALLALTSLFRHQVAERTRALSESEEKYRMLFTNSNDAVMVHQSSPGEKLQNFIEVNDVACSMYGYTREEMLNISVKALVDEAHEEKIYHVLEQIYEEKSCIFENVHHRKNKDPFPVEVSAYLFDFKGNPTILSIVRDITERKQAEQALRESEEKYRLLIENQIDLVVKVDLEGHLQFVSPSYCRKFGKTEAELLGQAFWPLVHPDDEAVTRQAMEGLFSSPRKASVEHRAMTREGCKWLAWVGTAVTDDTGQVVSIIAVGRDITENKEFEAALQTSQETFLSVLDSINATVYVSDIDTYDIYFMNKHMRDVFGADMTGQKCHEVFRNSSSPCVRCTNHLLLDDQGNPTGVHVWDDQNPITKRWYINYDRAIKWTDGRYVRLQIATDITDFKNMESELRQAHKMESIGTLAGGIAHDFNNILSIIIGYAELALDEIPDWSPSFQNISEIKTASLRAKDVVRQLLSFSRKGEQEHRPLALSAIIMESLQLIRASTPSSIEVRENIPDQCDMIMADATQIHQVLINLCTNASHAMTGERGRIEITLSPVTVSGENDDLPGEIRPGSYLKLMVTDNGSGIDPDISDRIFDPYFTTKDVGKGTGMGLAVVHGIIKNHNGHIFVDSEPGKGATFTILFPVLDQGSSRPDPTPEDGDANLSGKGHILFVDDEISLAELSKKIIESMGYTVEQYSNPRDALAVFRHSPERFDLLISDMTMPVMSGLDLANQIKEIRSDLPVIICTGHSSAINEEQSAEAGIDAFALKPITRSEIGHLIKGVLGTSD